MKLVDNRKVDIEAGFAQPDIIEEGTYFTPLIEQAFLETELGLACLDREGRISYPNP